MMIVDEFKLILVNWIICQSFGFIGVAVESWFMDDDQVALIHHGLFERLHIREHANHNPGYGILRVTGFEGVNCICRPWAGNLSFDHFNDLIGADLFFWRLLSEQ